MEIVYRLGSATASEVMAELPDPPSYSGVRALLRILEEKGHLRHEADGARYVYVPMVPRQAAGSRALKTLVETFFDGSAGMAAAALLDEGARTLSDAELDRLASLINRARKEGR